MTGTQVVLFVCNFLTVWNKIVRSNMKTFWFKHVHTCSRNGAGALGSIKKKRSPLSEQTTTNKNKKHFITLPWKYFDFYLPFSGVIERILPLADLTRTSFFFFSSSWSSCHAVECWLLCTGRRFCAIPDYIWGHKTQKRYKIVPGPAFPKDAHKMVKMLIVVVVR